MKGTASRWRRKSGRDLQPRPGYKAKSSRARLFEKVRGRIWLDKAEREIRRAEGVAFDTVSIGWGLVAKIEKGTRFELERTRIGEGLWAMTRQAMKFDARVMLVKNMSSEMTTRLSDLRHQSSYHSKAN